MQNDPNDFTEKTGCVLFFSEFRNQLRYCFHLCKRMVSDSNSLDSRNCTPNLNQVNFPKRNHKCTTHLQNQSNHNGFFLSPFTLIELIFFQFFLKK